MKKAVLPALLVMTVLLFGVVLAYVLYQVMPPKQAKPAETKVKTEIVTKEVKVPTAASADTEHDLKDIIKATQSKVVQIETSSAQGSGFLYNEKGDVITNAHVVGYERNVVVRTSSDQTFEGTVIGRSETRDIALIRVPGLAGTAPLKMKEKPSELGDDVVALGSPLGLQNTVTVGIISGLDRSFSLDPFMYENMYQITAPISPGNSGGPIVSAKDGAVLGINSVKHTTEHIGFSIPIYTVLAEIKGWSSHPMTFAHFEEEYEFEVPEYDGDITEDYRGDDYGEEYSEEYSDEYTDDYGDEGYPEETDGDDHYLTSYDAENAVYAFYDAVNRGSYPEAYEIIGGGWKATSPSLEDFAAGYENTLSTQITSSSVSDNGDGTFTVSISLTAEEYVDDTDKTSYYEMTYLVGLEDGYVKLLGGEMISKE
ncbi:S1C family serine protease [Fictibacillus iocasae]|uniref:S1C family serine protease n=1 Tax=Fictibacillus iocasae TaxID=2715437 RepID=A0ABW2NKC3_9BACL